MFQKFFERTFKSSTIHGFKYLADTNLGIFHRFGIVFLLNCLTDSTFIHFRIFWLVLIILSFVCTSLLLMSFMKNIARNPIVMSKSDVATSVTEVMIHKFKMNYILYFLHLLKLDSISGLHNLFASTRGT